MDRVQAAALARAALAAKRPCLSDRFWSKVDRSCATGCWPWTAGVRRKDEGYGAFWMGRKHRPAHRVAWELTFGGITDPEMVVCHRCDNPPCCNPSHLFLGTQLQNNDDKVAKRRHPVGERHHNALLTTAEVLEIRAAPKFRGYRVSLAAKFGVRPELITEIRAMKSWKEI